jgi:uncharacterized RDD family membrane protein YckC
MKCSKCGFAHTAQEKVCQNCGNTLQRPILIPFPVPSSQAGRRATASGPPLIPEWRIELRERVRAIRERRELEAATLPTVQHNEVAERVTLPKTKPTNPILEAALHRLRRGADGDSEKGLTATSAKNGSQNHQDSRLKTQDSRLETQDQRPFPATSDQRPATIKEPVIPSAYAYGVAPAMALSQSSTEPITEPLSPVELTAPSDEPVSSVECRVSDQPETQNFELETLVEQKLGDMLPERSDNGDWPVTNEDPVEYADVVDEDLEASTVPSLDAPDEDAPQTATFGQRFRSGMLDISVLALANVPFVALIELSNGSLLDPKIQIVLGVIALILYLFYTTLMLSVVGRTIGMMAVGMLAVDATSVNLPCFGQALRRALGFLLAAALAGLGFLVPAIDPKKRSLSDLISGTVVKSTFDELDELPEFGAPWLYRVRHP